VSPFAREQVELGQLVTLLLRADQRGSPVELIDDFEYRLLAPLGRQAGREQPAGSEMAFSAHHFRNQRVGRLVDAVVREFVRSAQRQDQFEAESFPQSRLHCLLRRFQSDRESGEIGGISDAGELLKRCLRGCRQPAQPANHELYDIVCITFGTDVG
jgi:hypothetical protein